jgi:endonuclease III
LTYKSAIHLISNMIRNAEKVFRVFKKHYQEIPLEIYCRDPYTTLISTLMSSRTKDEVTLEASKRLFNKAPNFKKLSQLDIDEIEKLIYPVGFYKTKSIHLKMLAKSVLTNYKGRIPKTRESLMRLPGVGRKTANLVLNRAFGKHAIAVDTHVHRITNILGWVKTKTPEQTEKKLIKILSKKYWSETNRLFVSIGRQFSSKQKLINFLKENSLI